MREVKRVVAVYEELIGVTFQAIGEILSWQQTISPDTKAKVDKAKMKREKIIRRYYL